MQSIGKTAAARKAEPSLEYQGEGVILPRLMRRPVRQFKRLLTGGFQVTRKGVIGSLIAFSAVAGGAAFHSSGSANSVLASVVPGLGIAINRYEISGNTEVLDKEIVSLLVPEHGASILTYYVEHARELLKSNPWIADARVSKIYPSSISVDIIEYKPFALWQNEFGLQMIDREGRVLAAYDGRNHALPLVVGKGAETNSAGILGMVGKYPGILSRTTAMIRVGDRRWDLELDNGTIVMLPERDIEKELARLAAYDRDEDLFGRDILRVDLRFADRMIVKLSDEAATSILDKRENQLQELVVARKGRDA